MLVQNQHCFVKTQIIHFYFAAQLPIAIVSNAAAASAATVRTWFQIVQLAR
nr:hypothetical protein [Leptolyngbya sp. FACHB-36]